jgi:chromosome segregation ATPase
MITNFFFFFLDNRTEDTNKLIDEVKLKNEKIQILEENLNDKIIKLELFENDLKNKINLIDNNNRVVNNLNNNNKENLIKISTTQLNDSNLHTNDYNILKDECAQLKIRIQAIEDEMKKLLFFFTNLKAFKKEIRNYIFFRARLENSQLSTDYSHLQQSYQELRELKETLENKESQIQINLTDAQKETDQNRDEIKQAQNRIKELEKKCNDYESNLIDLNNDLNYLHNEYDGLSMRTKVVCSILLITPFLRRLF